MTTFVSTVGAVNRVPLSWHGSGSGASASSSEIFGNRLKKVNPGLSHGRLSTVTFKVMAAELDESKQTEKDRTSPEEKEWCTPSSKLIPMGDGTYVAVMNSYEYINLGLRHYNLDNTMDGFYIAPAFLDKLVVHISKNFMILSNIKVPLILSIWGGKGQGKSFECELVCQDGYQPNLDEYWRTGKRKCRRYCKIDKTKISPGC